MHDPSHGSQVRSCSGEPPRGNQYLGRGQDTHHAQHGHVRRSMTTAAAGPPSRRAGSPPDSGPAASAAHSFSQVAGTTAADD